MAGVPSATPGVLRQTYASMSGDLGFSELVIAELLGHARGQTVTQGYIHLGTDPIRAAEERVQRHIWATLTGAQADVVPLPVAVAASVES